jgi:hypothetical protein
LFKDEEESQSASKKVLTHKEKKELKKKQKMEAELERISKKGGEGHSDLGANFTVAQVNSDFKHLGSSLDEQRNVRRP